MPPLLLVDLVASVHEFDFGTGDLGLRALKAAVAANAGQPLP